MVWMWGRCGLMRLKREVRACEEIEVILSSGMLLKRSFVKGL
jgi:hypothetical protein